jgi:hypothetical protein
MRYKRVSCGEVARTYESLGGIAIAIERLESKPFQ